MEKANETGALHARRWSARWGMWLLTVIGAASHWEASVYSVKHGWRLMLSASPVLASSQEAIDWGCADLASRGATVFIDGHNRPLQEFLTFKLELA